MNNPPQKQIDMYKSIHRLNNWYNEWIETLEILSDEAAMNQLRQSIIEVREKRTIPWNEAKKILGTDS